MVRPASMDRLSNLPDGTIHHIMSFLSPAEATVFSLLCKRLYFAWRLYPHLDFDSSYWADNPLSFFDFVRTCIGRHRHLDSRFQRLTFDLFVNRTTKKFKSYIKPAAETVATLAEYALSRRVSELRLRCHTSDPDFWGFPTGAGVVRGLPNSLLLLMSIRVMTLVGLKFESRYVIVNCPLLEDFVLGACAGVKSLEFCSGTRRIKRIEIRKCTELDRVRVDARRGSLRSFSFAGITTTRQEKGYFESRLIRTNKPCEISFDARSLELLESLSLRETRVMDDSLFSTVSGSGSIRTLTLDDLEVVGSLDIDSESLKVLEIRDCRPTHSVFIAAPDLESLHCPGSWYSHGFDISGCTNLKRLEFGDGFKATQEWVDLNLSVLGHLRDLKFEGFYKYFFPNYQELTVFLASLKSLELRMSQNRWTRALMSQNGWARAPIKIVCPNLASLVYSGDLKLTLVSFFESRNLKTASVELTSDIVDVPEFQTKFREFFGGFPPCNTLSFSIHRFANEFIYPKEVREGLSSPLNGVKNLHIEVRMEIDFDIVEFVDSLLWLAPRPDTVSMSSCSVENSKSTIKFCYGEVNGLEEDENIKCCSKVNSPVKCWRHGLAEVILEKFEDGHRTRLQRYFVENASDAKITFTN